MKKLLILGSVLALMSTSCSDLLLESPKAIAVETFYNTPEEIESAVLACYYNIAQAIDIDRFVIPECEVDYGYSRSSYTVVGQFKPLDATNINRLSDPWFQFYKAIDNANLVIANAPNASATSEEIIAELVAEARFIRAFCYFDLVRLWGGVPIRTEANRLETSVPRVPEEAVYELIVSDLEYAVANLPVSQSQGRPHEATAKAVLSHVYLQLQRYAESGDLALEVINSGTYSMVPVSESDDFYKIYGPDAATSSEEVFYIKFSRVAGYGSRLAIYAHAPGNPYLGGRGFYGLYTDSVKNTFIREWDYNDLRKGFNLYNWDIGLGETTMMYKKYVDPDIINSAYTANDYTAYRYPEILLYYAEAVCMENGRPTADAMEKLNMVRRRAYGLPVNQPAELDYNLADYDKESFLDLVLKERGYETFYEGKRFLDLKRMGKLESVIEEAHGITIEEAILLWPIPAQEYNFNDAIDEIADQNPGY